MKQSSTETMEHRAVDLLSELDLRQIDRDRYVSIKLP